MKNLSLFQKAILKAVSVLQLLAGAMIFATAIGVTLNAIVRYGLGRNIAILTEAGGFIFLFVVFSGLAATLIAGSHVSVDILSAIAPKRFVNLMYKFIVPLISMVFVGVVLISGLIMTQRYFIGERVTTGIVPIPLWIIMSIVPIGCLVMELALLSLLIDEVRSRMKDRQSKSG